MKNFSLTDEPEGGNAKEISTELLATPGTPQESQILSVNPFSTGTGWTLYKVYEGFRISY